MAKERRTLTFMVIPEGGQESRTVRIGYGRLRLLLGLAAVVALALALMAGSWWYLAARSVRVAELEAEVAQLRGEQAQVEALSRRLRSLEDRYERIRSLFGAETGPTDGSVWLPAAGGAGARRASPRDGDAPSRPTSWPLTERGFVTQTLLEASEGGEHPGVDIAIATDSYIRAAGAGSVAEAGQDSVYGNYVILEHSDGYRTVYGHASLLLVESGDRVRRNEVIALSGSSGLSSAPHLHFEVLQDGEPVDPLTLLGSQ